jgi:prepilin-type N-terminal cleavage/methylation domain-containing protein
MYPPHDRSGFTLIETMLATTIATVVMLALASAFIFCQRMFRLTMTEAESTLALREVRDKLLFRAGPGLNSGLLTGKASGNAAAITMSWDDPTESSNCIRIVWRENNFFNERQPHTAANLKWFIPSGFQQQQTWAQTVDLPRIRLELGSPVEDSVRQTSWILLPQ